MERIYNVINEDLAYNAKQQWSFTEYKKGSYTQEYKSSCDEVYDLVERVQQEQPKYFDEAYGIAVKYASKYADWINTKHNIDMMCPSVMICGGANFPTKKKERQNSRMDSHWKELEYINSLPKKIEKILKGEVVIKSGDAEAIEKLKNKLADLEARKQMAIDGNKYYRKNKTLEGFTGIDEAKIKQTMDFINRGIFGSSTSIFDTSNLNQNIKSVKARISQLEKAKEKGTQEVTATTEEGNELFKVIENTEIMRLQLIFDGKPSEEVRSLLKSNGYKWSPKNEAWQRQLTENARYSLKRIKPELEKLLA